MNAAARARAGVCDVIDTDVDDVTSTGCSWAGVRMRSDDWRQTARGLISSTPVHVAPPCMRAVIHGHETPCDGLDCMDSRLSNIYRIAPASKDVYTTCMRPSVYVAASDRPWLTVDRLNWKLAVSGNVYINFGFLQKGRRTDRQDRWVSDSTASTFCVFVVYSLLYKLYATNPNRKSTATSASPEQIHSKLHATISKSYNKSHNLLYKKSTAIIEVIYSTLFTERSPTLMQPIIRPTCTIGYLPVYSHGSYYYILLVRTKLWTRLGLGLCSAVGYVYSWTAGRPNTMPALGWHLLLSRQNSCVYACDDRRVVCSF